MGYVGFAWRNRRFLGFGLLLAFVSNFGQTFFIGLFGAEIRGEFALSHGGFGTAYAIGTLLAGAALIWLGRIIDRADLRSVAIGVCLALIASCFLMAFVPGVIVLGVAFFALRLSGQGLLAHTYGTAMARYFDADRGKAISVATLGHPLGEAVLPSLVVALVAAIGWRHSWVAFGAVNLLILLPAVLWLLKGHAERHRAHLTQMADAPAAGTTRQWTRREALGDPRFYLAHFGLLAPAFLFTGFFFHQVHLADAKGWSLAWLATAFTAYAAASVAAMIGGGLAVDRFGARRLAALPLVALFGAMALLVFADHKLVAVLYMLAAGGSVGLLFSVTGAVWAELYGVRHLGAIRAIVMAAMVAATAASPAVFGWLIDAGVSLEAIATAGLAWAAVGGIVVVVALRREA